MKLFFICLMSKLDLFITLFVCHDLNNYTTTLSFIDNSKYIRETCNHIIAKILSINPFSFLLKSHGYDNETRKHINCTLNIAELAA